MAGAGSQLEFELAFFTGVLERFPRHLAALRVQARNWAAKGEHRKAAEVGRTLAEVSPDEPWAHLHLACCLCRLGHADEALAALRCCLQLGYADADTLAEEADLDPLRGDGRFAALLAEFGIAAD